jgi:predicted nuclease of restriction endonuclease-like RecB superfamily
LAEAAAVAGRSTREADERVVDNVMRIARKHGAGRRVVDGVWAVERSRWSTRIASRVPPRRIRQTLFPLAAERSREEALSTAAAELGISAQQIEACLFADRARARLLTAPESVATTSELVDRYNLAVVQTLLTRATEVTATVRANLRPVVAYAKLLGLMATFDHEPDGAARMTLSGPMALFHETIKYGKALARWFPALVATPGWSLTARVVLGGEAARLDLDAGAPLPRTFAMARAHDSKLEERLEADLRRLGSTWKIEREAAVVRVAGKLCFPDFSLVSGDDRVLVEVVGYWTPEYLAQKAAMLREVRSPMVLCVDRRHARGELEPNPRVLAFSKRIDAAELVNVCAAVARGTGGSYD